MNFPKDKINITFEQLRFLATKFFPWNTTTDLFMEKAEHISMVNDCYNPSSNQNSKESSNNSMPTF